MPKLDKKEPIPFKRSSVSGRVVSDSTPTNKSVERPSKTPNKETLQSFKDYDNNVDIVRHDTLEGFAKSLLED